MASEAMVFNGKQGVVLDDIARYWKADKNDRLAGMPCIFFVDIRGDSFHVIYDASEDGRLQRDSEFSTLSQKL